jgi:hypothetical protein
MLLVNVAFAGIAGGGLAVGVLWLIHHDLTYPRLTLVLVVLIAVLAVLATAALQADGVAQPDPREPVPPPPPPDVRQPEPWFSSAARGQTVAKPVPTPTFTPAPAVPQPQPEPSGPPTVDEYELPGARRAKADRVRRVVQCPSCGDFAVDLYRTPPSFVFTCRRCEHRWTWAPGQPWPATVVRPSVPSTRPI